MRYPFAPLAVSVAPTRSIYLYLVSFSEPSENKLHISWPFTTKSSVYIS